MNDYNYDSSKTYSHLNNNFECDFTTLTWDFTDDTPINLQTVSIGELLQTDIPNIFILRDIHDRILKMIKISHLTEEDVSILTESIEGLSIQQCEAFYRYYIKNRTNEIAEHFPSIIHSGLFSISTIYGWLLPYYVDYQSYPEDLERLPVISENIRPSPTDLLPHSFALHYAHQSLAMFEKIYSDLNDDGKEPAHLKGTKARLKIYEEADKILEQAYIEMMPEFKNKGAKSGSKRATMMWDKYHSKLGFERSTLDNKIRALKRKHG